MQKRILVFLGIVLILAALTGCGQVTNTQTEPPKPAERWKFLGESNDCNFYLDTQSIVKMQTDKAVASTTDTVKREIVSAWVKAEPVPGKEKEFTEKYGEGKEVSYGLLYYRIDKLNREAMFVQANGYNSKGVLSSEFIQPLQSFKPYAIGTIVERIANEL